MTTEALGPILQVTNTIDSDGIRPASPGVSVPTKTLEFDATASADASDSNAEHTPSGVQTIQHYELIRRLGEGGMGAVMRSWRGGWGGEVQWCVIPRRNSHGLLGSTSSPNSATR